MEAILVSDAYRMMTVANPLEDSIEIGFADGARGCIPYKDIPEIEERTALSSLALPNPHEMVLETFGGVTVEIPWDFARHYCDAAYRPAIEAIAMQGRRTLGERIRGFRESAGLTQAGARPGGQHRAGDPGAIGEGGAVAPTQDP